MRNSFVFYRSFSEAISELTDDEQLKAFWNIVNYALEGIEPDEKGAARAVYKMAKPQIDSNNIRYQNGKKGGRHKTKAEPSTNQEETKIEPNVNDNVNVNDKNKYTCAFETMWSVYPRKKEKAKAYKCYKTRLGDGFSEDELLLAVKRYAEDCKAKKTEEQYIKLAATFLGPNTPFTDYLGDYQPSKKNSNSFNNFEGRKYDMAAMERQLLGVN